MKKAFDQTVRDLKRGVNKKVLKVPSIKQKVLDATSNESWGPHGTLLANIAQATKKYHEYELIMSVLWKRTNDTGKNWRHVFKALTVLEYLVAHGPERVITEIKEHEYKIQTLSYFHYIDSSGRDQGSNVRKKSQNLVVLVNDKERIQEVREKAASNREKLRDSPVANMYRPGTPPSSGGYGGRYDDDHYGSRGDEWNGNERGREYGYRDDDQYKYGCDGDRYGREYEERDGEDDDFRGRSRSVDNHSSRGRSSDGDKNEDDDQYSSRGSGAKADDQSQDGRTIYPKLSEQNLGAPPSYEEVIIGVETIGGRQSPTHTERDGKIPKAAPKPSSPPASSNPTQATSTAAPAPNSPAVTAMNETGAGEFDEFDPRGLYSAASTTSSSSAVTMSVGGEMDFLLSSSESFTTNLLASMTTSLTSSSEVDSLTNSLTTFTPTDTPSAPSQGFEDPFGDGPFKAIPSQNGAACQQHQGFGSISFQSGFKEVPELPQQVSQGAAEGSFSGTTSTPFGEPNVQPSSANGQYQQQGFLTQDLSIDILADILPPTGPQPRVHPETLYAAPGSRAVPQSSFMPETDQNLSPVTFSSQSEPPVNQTDFPAQSGQPSSLCDQPGENLPQATFSLQSGPTALQTGFAAQSGQPTALTSFSDQPGQLVVHPNFPTQFDQPAPQGGFGSHGGQPPSLSGYGNQAEQAPQTGFTFQMNQSHHGSFHGLGVQAAAPNPVLYGNYNVQPGYGASVDKTRVPQVSAGSTSQVNATNSLVASHMTFTTGQVGSSSMVASQADLPSISLTSSTAPPSNDKQFTTKSTVWEDTLSRGLVNLDISGVKTNPLSDIGIDLDAINRKEKRLGKPSTAPVTSTHMGKAMGSGSGMGHAGASALRPPANPMMGTGTNTGMIGMGEPRPWVGMAGYVGMNQQAMGAGMGMNMNIGGHMQQPMGFPPGFDMQGVYNPKMGAVNHGRNACGGYRSV